MEGVIQEIPEVREMEFDKIKMVRQPKKLKIRLFNHQLATVYEMEQFEKGKLLIIEDCETTTRIALNTNMVGYGKTLSMIALILRDRMEWNMEKKFKTKIIQSFGSGLITQVSRVEKTKINCSLILVHSSIAHQWMNEFRYSKLRVFPCLSPADVSYMNAHLFDVVVCVQNTLVALVKKYDNYAWKRFIYDEPSVPIPKMPPVFAGFTWLVSATPEKMYEVYHRRRECYMKNILQGIPRNYLSYFSVSFPKEYLELSFRMPEVKTITYDCYNPMFKIVAGLVPENIQNLIEAGNISGAIEVLGGSKTSNLVSLIKHDKARKIREIENEIFELKFQIESQTEEEKKRIPEKREKDEEKQKRHFRKNMETLEESKREKTKVLDSLVKSVEEIEKRFLEFANSPCLICADSLKNPVMESRCQNIFCGKCISSWLAKNRACPLCRNENPDLVEIKDWGIDGVQVGKEKIKREKTREEILLEILTDKSKRIIIYAKWPECFDNITKILYKNKLPFIEIKGSAEKRERLLTEFRTGKVSIAFLTSKQDSTGINMVETTDIILYHVMESSDVKQIIGRANRMGRTIPLTVHALICKGEKSEKEREKDIMRQRINDEGNVERRDIVEEDGIVAEDMEDIMEGIDEMEVD